MQETKEGKEHACAEREVKKANTLVGTVLRCVRESKWDVLLLEQKFIPEEFWHYPSQTKMNTGNREDFYFSTLYRFSKPAAGASQDFHDFVPYLFIPHDYSLDPESSPRN